MQQIASAVKYLHGINVAHRDMKPENVLLKNMHAKVSDLGLAKILKTKKSKSNSGVFGT